MHILFTPLSTYSKNHGCKNDRLLVYIKLYYCSKNNIWLHLPLVSVVQCVKVVIFVLLENQKDSTSSMFGNSYCEVINTVIFLQPA